MWGLQRATVWGETGNETRKLKNVIRSDGYCRPELLGSYPRGSREEDQSSVVRDVVEANTLLSPRRKEAFCPNPLERLPAHRRPLRRPHPGGDRQPRPRRRDRDLHHAGAGPAHAESPSRRRLCPRAQPQPERAPPGPGPGEDRRPDSGTNLGAHARTGQVRLERRITTEPPL